MTWINPRKSIVTHRIDDLTWIIFSITSNIYLLGTFAIDECVVMKILFPENS